MNRFLQRLIGKEKMYQCIVHSRDGLTTGSAEMIADSKLDEYVKYWDEWNYDVEIIGQGFGDGTYG